MDAHLKMRNWLAGLAASLLVMVTSNAATTPAPVGGDDSAMQDLDEVEVSGTRLWKLRSQMVDLEDRFYALYNQLSTNDDFDVHCRKGAPLGTRITSRRCKVAFHEEAEAEYAQSILAGFYAPEPQLVELERRSEYRQAALQVINSDARLRRLIREREELEKRYVAERKKQFKGRWIRF